MPAPTPRPSHLRLVPPGPATVPSTPIPGEVATSKVSRLRELADAFRNLEDLEWQIQHTKSARELWLLEQMARRLRSAIAKASSSARLA